MKPLLFTILLFSFLGLRAQDKNESKVAKPDSVFSGQIVTDKTHHTKIYLTDFKQTVDDSGIYTTTYIFGARIPRTTFDININMKFQEPLVADGPIGFQYGPYGAGRYSGAGALRNNNSYLFMQGQMTSGNHHFYITVKSKEKPHPVIAGLDGQMSF